MQRTRALRNTECTIDLSQCELVRFPGDLLRAIRFPVERISQTRIKVFESPSGTLRVASPQLAFKHHYNAVIPNVVKVFLCWGHVDLLAGAAAIGVGRRVQRLMDVTHKMD